MKTSSARYRSGLRCHKEQEAAPSGTSHAAPLTASALTGPNGGGQNVLIADAGRHEAAGSGTRCLACLQGSCSSSKKSGYFSVSAPN